MTKHEAVMLNALRTIAVFAENNYAPDAKHLYENDIKAIRAVVCVTLECSGIEQLEDRALDKESE